MPGHRKSLEGKRKRRGPWDQLEAVHAAGIGRSKLSCINKCFYYYYYAWERAKTVAKNRLQLRILVDALCPPPPPQKGDNHSVSLMGVGTMSKMYRRWEDQIPQPPFPK